MSYYKTIVEKDSSIKTIHRIIPYKFSIEENDNINDNIESWLQTDRGRFIKENSTLIDIVKQLDVNSYSIKVALTVEIEESKLIEYQLKFN